MTKSFKDALLEIEGAITDAQTAATTNRVPVDSFFPDTRASYPLWAWDSHAQAFKYLADDVVDRIGRVQDLVQAHWAAEREVSS